MNEREEILVPKIDIIGKVFQFIVYILFLTLIVTISTYLSIKLDIKDILVLIFLYLREVF